MGKNPFSDREKYDLIFMMHGGFTVAEMATRIDRTTQSVGAQIKSLRKKIYRNSDFTEKMKELSWVNIETGSAGEIDQLPLLPGLALEYFFDPTARSEEAFKEFGLALYECIYNCKEMPKPSVVVKGHFNERSISGQFITPFARDQEARETIERKFHRKFQCNFCKVSQKAKSVFQNYSRLFMRPERYFDFVLMIFFLSKYKIRREQGFEYIFVNSMVYSVLSQRMAVWKMRPEFRGCSWREIQVLFLKELIDCANAFMTCAGYSGPAFNHIPELPPDFENQQER